MLFDLVVGASSIYGGSWLEGAGAVFAENEALRWLADLAGLPPEAGGVFVAGGSAGNLCGARRRPARLAAAVARPSAPQRAARRWPAPAPTARSAAAAGDGRRRRRACRPTSAAASPAKRSPRRRRRSTAPTGPGPCRRGRHRRHHERRHRRRPRGRRRGGPRARRCGSTSTAPTAAAALVAPCVRASLRRRRAGRQPRRRPAQVAVRAVRLRRPALPGPGDRPGGAHAARRVPRRRSPSGRLEPERLRVPPDPPGPRPAVLVLAGHARHRAPTPTRSRTRCASPRDAAAADPTTQPTSSWSSSPSCRSCCSAVSAGGRRLRAVERRGARRRASR